MITQAAMAALFPMVALGIVALWVVYSQHAFMTHNLQDEIAHRAQLLIETELDNVVTVLQTAVNAAGWLSVDSSSRTHIRLHYLLHQLPSVREIDILDASGRTRLRASRVQVYSEADEKVFNVSVLSNQESLGMAMWGEAYVSPCGEPMIQLLIPIPSRVHESTQGYLLAVVSLRKLWDQLSVIRSDPDEIIYILDEKGRLLAHPDFSLVLSGTSLTHSVLYQTLQSGQDLPATYDGIDGTRVFGSVAPVPDLHGWVVVEKPMELAMRPIRRLINLLLLGLFLALIASAVPGWFIAHRVTQPVAQLARDAIAVGKGDLSRRSPVKRTDEIGLLAVAFNQMIDDLEQYANTLEMKVAERTKELEIALGQAEEADRLKTAFLATVSHELRTPLASIKGFAETLLSTDVEWDRETQEDFLRTIVEETERLRLLVNQLLDMAQIEAGTLPLRRRAVSISNILRLTVERIAPVASTHPIHLDIPSQVPLILADPERVMNIVRNLLENAIHYTPPGTDITIRVSSSSREILISVVDKGPGIPAKILPHLFERFLRGDHKNIPGTGLGLAICKGLVEAHGGRIWAENVSTGGAAFHFTLPLATPDDGDTTDEGDT